MPDPDSLRRPARLALACLAATVLIPLPGLFHDLRVRGGAEAVQAAEDRLDELEPRLRGGPPDRGPLGLAEDVALRRAVGEILQELQRHAEWVPDLDLVDLRLRVDAWFTDRVDGAALADLSGAVHAAVRRSRAELQSARWVSLAACLAALVPAGAGILALLRLQRRLGRFTERRPGAMPSIPVPPAAAVSIPAETPPMQPPLPPAPTPLLRRAPAPESTPAIGIVGPLRGRVLLVEDNPINQRVTQRQLAELALLVEIAPDAETGLTRMAEERWDAVMMDLQLPGMDGLAATRQWRAHEVSRGARRTPIIAITANALGTDRDACFAAGMDGYLAKPARLEDLYRALVRFLGSSVPPPTPAATHAAIAAALAGPAPVTDPTLWAKLRAETASSDPRMLEELMEDLRVQAPHQLSELSAAHAAGEWEALRSTAHRLKGSAGMLGLPRLSAAAKAVEQAAKAREAPRAHEALGDLALAISETFADPTVAALR